MTILLLTVISASLFSIGGLGEDLGVFETPFLKRDQRAVVEFLLKPEFNVLNKGGDFRSIFWTNPFDFSLTVPFGRGFIFSVGNCERYSQSFDVYLEEEDLKLHVLGQGGISEIYANVNNDFNIGQIALRAAYLFGHPWEIWEYSIDSYYLTDTFSYTYRGKIFSAGLRMAFVSVAYEGLGSMTMETATIDTTIDLPDRLSISANPQLFGGKIGVMYEHSFWHSNDNHNYISPHRFKIGFEKQRIGIQYFYNPWYLEDVTEHGINFSWAIPIRNIGSARFTISCAMRSKDDLREFKIIPELQFTLRELFALRK
jgi:hypothetical protein